MKRLILLILIAAAVGGAVAAFLSRPVQVPVASGTWAPAEHEPVTN